MTHDPSRCEYCSKLTTPADVTYSGRQYYEEVERTLNFFNFIIDRTVTGDYVAFVAAEALEGRDIPEPRTPLTS